MNTEATPNEMSEALARGEQFTRVFVQPMVAAMRTEMQAHQEKLDQTLTSINVVVGGFGARLDADEKRIIRLERDQKKALLGWSCYATVAAGLFTYCYGWIKSKVHVG